MSGLRGVVCQGFVIISMDIYDIMRYDSVSS